MDLEPSETIELTSAIPVPKRYAHRGKRRRSYTEEMFRCPFVDMISRTPLVCNHLLFRDKISELRDHLIQHKNVAEVQVMTDDEVRACFIDAKRIFLKGIPEDVDDEDDDLEESEEE